MSQTMNNAAYEYEVPTKRRRTSLLQGLLCVAAYASLVSAPAAHAFTPDASNNLGANKQASAASSFVEAELFPASFSSFQSRTTARESAVLVEWERMSELERRIEDGINYEYDPFMSDSNFVAGRNYHKNAAANAAAGQSRNKEKKKSAPPTRGVFCGYRATQEEIDRLKSADPNARF
jgi:hypothetical protein